MTHLPELWPWDAALWHANTVWLDARQLACPLPLLKLKQQLKHIPNGTVVYLQTTDAHSEQDILRYAAHAGLNVQHFTKTASAAAQSTVFHFLISP